MKVKSIKLRNFKGADDVEIDFRNEETGLAKDLVILIGQSGGGKTRVLQAIAAAVGEVKNRINTVKDLKWPGYNYNLIEEFKVEVRIETRTNELNLTWEGKESREEATSCEIARGLAKEVKIDNEEELKELRGTVLWYTEQRSNRHEYYNNELDLNNEDNLRKYLLELKRSYKEDNTSEKGKIYKRIENIYKDIFQREFILEDAEYKKGELGFYINNGKDIYEISEISGGERSIIPFMIDFGTKEINNSIILIDEIELHLYPSAQQALLRNLYKWGHNNQFIISTNSDYIESLSQDINFI